MKKGKFGILTFLLMGILIVLTGCKGQSIDGTYNTNFEGALLTLTIKDDKVTAKFEAWEQGFFQNKKKQHTIHGTVDTSAKKISIPFDGENEDKQDYSFEDNKLKLLKDGKAELTFYSSETNEYEKNREDFEDGDAGDY